MNFVKGKKLKIKTIDQILKIYPGFKEVPMGFNDSMKRYLGNVVTLDEIKSNSSWGGFTIHIKEDGNSWSWHSSLFTDNDVTDRVYEVLRGK